MCADKLNDHEKLCLLLVEDDPDHAELAIHCFNQLDNNLIIHHTQDGEETLAYLMNTGKYEEDEIYCKPHLILLDLRLPRIDGLEVLEEIKKNDDTKNIPVVILTTSESDKDALKAYELNANSYLVKPGGYHELKKMLSEVNSYWLGLNRRL